MIEVGNMVFLVRRVQVIIGQAGAHKDDRRMQLTVEESTYGNRATGPLIYRRPSPLLLQSTGGRTHKDAVNRHQYRVPSMYCMNFHPDSRRTELRNALLQERRYLSWPQARRKPQTYLSRGLGGNHGLGSCRSKATFN